jgi:methyl-accepting chemotaxis protein
VIPLADIPQLVPFWVDSTFKGALVALVVALTGWIGWLMRERKAQREEPAPGGGLSHSARQELETMKSEVKALKDGMSELSEKADDLARGVETAAANIRELDEKVDDAAVQVKGLTTDMEWVKKALEAIGRKLGI